MEYEKKDWQRSEGRYRSLGRESRDKEKPLSAYRPADRENTKEQKPNEMMTMESSYGGISFGANQHQKMTMVVHEKRSRGASTLKRDNQEVDGNRTASFSELCGDFYTNSHSRQDSALVYEEELKETPLRMMERLQEMMDETDIRSGKKVLPFLSRNEDQAKRKEIQEQLRERLEKRDTVGYALWSRRQEAFAQEQAEKEQMRLKFYQELTYVREKAKQLMKEDAPVINDFIELILEEKEDGSEEDTQGKDE